MVKYSKITDLSYASKPTCKLDLYIPRTAPPFPVVMVVHGGAWLFGDKSKTESSCTILAEHGYLAVTINYTLSRFPDAVFRQTLWWMTVGGTLVLWALQTRSVRILLYLAIMACAWMVYLTITFVYVPHEKTDGGFSHLGDVESALEWILQNISRYGGNPNVVALLGHSAGAHLISLLTSRRHANVCATVCVGGVYSTERLRQINGGDWLMRCAFGELDDFVTVSPVLNVHSQMPPQLLVNARWDFSLIRHTWDMALTLRSHGVYVQTHCVEGDHLSIMHDWTGSNQKLWLIIHRFLREAIQLRKNLPTKHI